MLNPEIKDLFATLSARQVTETILSLIEEYFPIMKDTEKQELVVRLLGRRQGDNLSSMVSR